jgi:hypothetical protein
VQSLMDANHHVLEEVASLKANIEQLHHQMSERERMLTKQAEFDSQEQTILSKYHTLISANVIFLAL